MSTPRTRLAALIITLFLTVGVLTNESPAEPPPEQIRMSATVASEAIMFPPTPTPTTSTTIDPAPPPPPPPVTTSTEPPPAPQPVVTVEAPEAAPAASGGVSDVIREVFSPYGQGAVDTALRVAQCESQMDPGALSDSGTYAGLFQVGNFWAEDFLSQTGVPYYDGRFDPLASSRFAVWLAYEAPGGGWQHWSCY